VRAGERFFVARAAAAFDLRGQPTEPANALCDEHPGGETCHGSDEGAHDNRG